MLASGAEPFSAYLYAINVASMLAVISDKASAAGRKAFRIPEKTFYALAAIFGSAGVLFACFIVRHKTRKLYFLGVTFGFLVLQILLLSVVF